MRIPLRPLLPDADTTGVLRRDGVGIVLVAAVCCALLTWRVGAAPELPAVLGFAVLAAALIVCDIRLMRLPDALTLPAYPLLVVLLAVPLDGRALLRGLIAMAAVAAGHLLLALIAGGIGLGDVKASGLVGLVLGFVSWGVVARGLLLAYLAVGVYAVVLAVATKARRETAVPFGPFLLGAAVLVLMW